MLHLRSSLLLLAMTVLLTAGAQQIKRQSIGTMGSSSQMGSTYVQECFGQAYQTLGSPGSYHPGFIQPQTAALSFATPNWTVKAYPVPVAGILNLQWDLAEEGARISMYSLHGVEVRAQEIPFAQSAAVDCGDLAPGTYIIELHIRQETKRLTIIKQ